MSELATNINWREALTYIHEKQPMAAQIVKDHRGGVGGYQLEEPESIRINLTDPFQWDKFQQLGIEKYLTQIGKAPVTQYPILRIYSQRDYTLPLDMAALAACMVEIGDRCELAPLQAATMESNVPEHNAPDVNWYHFVIPDLSRFISKI